MDDLDFMKETPLMEVLSSTNSSGEDNGFSNPIKDSQSTPSQDGLKVVLGPIDPPHIETNLGEKPESHSLNIDLAHCFVTDQVFDSREALINWCQDVGKKNNTVLVIAKSRKTMGGKGSKLEIGCERGGVYKDHKKKGHQPKTPIKRKRERFTRKCGCPFKLRGVWMEGNKWTLRVKCGSHNHEIAKTLTGHAFVARLKEEEKQLVIQLTSTGVRPRQVLSALKEKNTENYSTLRTIYNVRAKLKLHQTEGRSAMQQVMKLLTQYHYVESHRRDEETDEVRDIFWAHPESTLLTKCFPSVLMVDCTCKTNRFKMPLFHIVGVTSTGRSFTVAFAFIEEDTEEHYIWVLTQLKALYSPNTLPSVFVTDRDPALINAITVVFPRASRLLCTWHINRDVQANCKKAFEKNDEDWKQFYNDWNYVWRAETKDEYGDAYADFVTKWALSYPSSIAYLRDSWLVHKELFVFAWTHKVKHFGNTTTNRESEHSKLKTYLGSSTDNFVTCWEAMHNLIKNEIVQIKASFEHSSTSMKHDHPLPALEELRNHVSHKALELIILEINRSETVGIDLSSCKCFLRTSHGLPCAHELVQYAHEGRPIPLSEIDPQWRQLSIVPMQERQFGFDGLPEVQLLRQKWIEASESERCSLIQKIKEFVTPKTTHLQMIMNQACQGCRDELSEHEMLE